MRALVGLCVAIGSLAGCIEAALVDCGDGTVCPVGSTCVPGGGCSSPQQEQACEGRAEGEACSLPNLGEGVCTNGLCVLAVCGNGRVEGLEACDDGNNVSGDGCSASCDSSELCGNGLVDVGEACDLGAANALDPDAACRPGCVLPACGDGVVDVARGELCDAGAANASAPDAPCRPDCRPQRCGDGIVDPQASEVCDDGNLAVGDGCTPDCASDERCGNGILDFFAGEECDDGNLQNHDRCSSACAREAPAFARRARQPSARNATPIAYDRARHRVVLFGGYVTGGAYTRDTWEWDGIAWTERLPARRPTARYGGVMAYDAVRNRTVLFGGWGERLDLTSGELHDTWEWDGANWTPSTATGPMFAYRMAMAFDDSRGCVVLIDGGTTWSYDGAWTVLATSSPPDPAGMTYVPQLGLVASAWNGTMWRFDGAWSQITELGDPAVLAYDEGRGQLVARTYGQTYAFDGTAWLEIASYDDVTVYSPGLVYEPRFGRLMMFGGDDDFYTNPGFIQRFFSNAAWTEWTPPSTPSARGGHAMAYDPLRGRTVLFGGGTSTQTWEWDGSAWQLMTPATSSPPATGSVMAYDPATSGVLLVNSLGQTWTWNGVDWTQRAPTSSPPPRNRPGLATDPTAPRVVLFGGEGADGYYADTWVWDGATWSQLASPQAPSARVAPGLATDAHRQRIVLFGGFTYTTDEIGSFESYANHQDTWEWDGATWTRVFSDDLPPGRYAHTLVYDPLSRTTLMFGGNTSGTITYFGDVWQWDGSAWTQLALPTTPPARSRSGGAYHATRAEIVLFGGGVSTSSLGDTWAFRYEATTPDEACSSGQDFDGDGAIGCLDADCGALCQPACLPALEDAGVCMASDGPYCGDGTCSVWLEDCALCPGDCGACP